MRVELVEHFHWIRYLLNTISLCLCSKLLILKLVLRSFEINLWLLFMRYYSSFCEVWHEIIFYVGISVFIHINPFNWIWVNNNVLNVCSMTFDFYLCDVISYFVIIIMTYLYVRIMFYINTPILIECVGMVNLIYITIMRSKKFISIWVFYLSLCFVGVIKSYSECTLSIHKIWKKISNIFSNE